MTPPEHLTVTGPEDILGFIPHSLGYWPADSLVAMTMQGKRLGATLRLDLPDRTVPCRAGDFCPDGARLPRWRTRVPTAPCWLFFTNDGCARRRRHCTERSAGRPGSPCWIRPACRSGTPGTSARTTGVTPTAWMPSCCPCPGRPVQEIRDSMLNAEMVYRGSSVGPAPERQDAAARPVPGHAPAPPSWRPRKQRGRRSWLPPGAAGHSSGRSWMPGRTCWPGLPGSPGVPDVDRDGFLRASLSVPHWRDAVLVMAQQAGTAAEAGAEGLASSIDAASAGGDQPPLLDRQWSRLLRRQRSARSTAGERWGACTAHGPAPVRIRCRRPGRCSRLRGGPAGPGAGRPRTGQA